jgi:hypothetical protein
MLLPGSDAGGDEDDSDGGNGGGDGNGGGNGGNNGGNKKGYGAYGAWCAHAAHAYLQGECPRPCCCTAIRSLRLQYMLLHAMHGMYATSLN